MVGALGAGESGRRLIGGAGHVRRPTCVGVVRPGWRRSRRRTGISLSPGSECSVPVRELRCAGSGRGNVRNAVRSAAGRFEVLRSLVLVVLIEAWRPIARVLGFEVRPEVERPFVCSNCGKRLREPETFLMFTREHSDLLRLRGDALARRLAECEPTRYHPWPDDPAVPCGPVRAA